MRRRWGALDYTVLVGHVYQVAPFQNIDFFRGPLFPCDAVETIVSGMT
jgi:hypothetical protein